MFIERHGFSAGLVTSRDVSSSPPVHAAPVGAPAMLHGQATLLGASGLTLVPGIDQHPSWRQRR